MTLARMLKTVALIVLAGGALLMAQCSPALAATAADLGVDPRAAAALALTAHDHAPGSCHIRRAANGLQLPDPACTPGAVNPTVTAAVIADPAWRTGMVRDKLTSAAAKDIVYAWYGIAKPAHNRGADQVCEIDHLVDLYIGGADSLENVWPQCQAPGAPSVLVGEREFKIKDRFAEHDVMRLIKAGADLADIQRRIAEDWTQFVAPSAD